MNNNPDPLSVKNSDYLRTVCDSLKLGDCFEAIEEITRYLQHFEQYGKAAMKSPRERMKVLGNVAAAAKALAAAINQLDYIQNVDIVFKLPPDGLTTLCEFHLQYPLAPSTVELRFGVPSPDCHVCYPSNANIFGRVGHIGIEAARLSKCCGDMYKEENTTGAKGGRKPTLDRYAEFIRIIWESVDGHSINLGRGGDFEKLCEAVFIAAGVRTEPEGAIRRFTEQCKAAENMSDDETF